ncbi:MAG: amidohydrolase [Planctomycetes bacterium]|nr:amidohydrolase [Planctomycetota bacterium]
MARKIWAWAEPGYQETKSSALLADTLEKAGFKIERGIAKMPTAFTATYGQGKPVVAILGEFDALPEISQTSEPFRQRVEGNNFGHGCGHHLFGVASASAAIAIKEQLEKGTIKGTVRFYGCPAEEGGGAKAFMVRDGYFKDCDIALHWHPGNRNSAGDSSSLARMAVKFRFHGIQAHAAGSPDKGRSALDAVQLTCHAAELLREHCPDFTRIHHVITHGGGSAPNVVPEFAEVYFYIRHPKGDIVSKLYPRLLKCAEGAALATETKLEVKYEGGIVELLPNEPLSQVIKKNLTKLNDITYTDEETKFALRIQESFETKPPLDGVKQVINVSGSTGLGSTDVGDVSWVVPTAGFSTACFVPGSAGHSWQNVAASGTTIGKKGMQLAAKTLAASAWDLFQDPKLIEAANEEHKRRLNSRVYISLMGKDQPPPLDYRNPPKR